MLANSGFITLGAQRLEYRMLGPRPDAAPTLVLLHEGLGCAAAWGDFPDRLQQATGAGVFVYSRAGYGQSSPLPRPLGTVQEEATETLPRLLDAIGFRHGVLVGHDDGASIVTIYTGSRQDHRVGGLVLIAPQFFAEEKGFAAAAETRAAYAGGDLRQQLCRWHADADNVFRSWSGVRLDPAFRQWDITSFLAYIRVPVLIVQGADDPYGTARQIEIAQRECYCPVEAALLPGARHAPQQDAPAPTLAAIAEFVGRVLAINDWVKAA